MSYSKEQTVNLEANQPDNQNAVGFIHEWQQNMTFLAFVGFSVKQYLQMSDHNSVDFFFGGGGRGGEGILGV